jgi:hypothetical protein
MNARTFRRYGLGLLLLASAGALAGCVVGSTAQSNQVITDLTTIGNTATADLNSTIAVANAATPPDTAGATCAQAALQVAANIQKVVAATPAGSTVGAFTTAEIASLYQPGSPQFNQAVTTIETGCIAKLHQINQAGASTLGMPAAIVAALGIAASPAGL